MGLRRLFRRLTGQKPRKSKSVGVEIQKEYLDHFGGTSIKDEDGLKIVSYDRDGAFDYDFYKAAQNKANAEKIDAQWVTEDRIVEVAKIVEDFRPNVSFGICHGTRAGREQAWFKQYLPGAPHVMGTDIADSASQFPNTIQWDFHETNPDWSGKADFVYSNSWDHAFDPEKAFGAWIDALAPGGILLLDHSKEHDPDAVSAMDPFGATIPALSAALDRWFEGRGRTMEVRDTGLRKDAVIKTLIFQKNPATA